MTSNPVAAGATTVGNANAEVDIDSVAAAVRACPAVDDLAGGRLASVVTYLPGRQVGGLRVEPGRVTVQVRAVWNLPIAEVAAQIRSALAPLVGTRTIDVELADVADPAPSTTVVSPQLPAGGSVETWTPSMPGARPSDGSSSVPTTPTVAETRTNS